MAGDKLGVNLRQLKEIIESVHTYSGSGLQHSSQSNRLSQYRPVSSNLEYGPTNPAWEPTCNHANVKFRRNLVVCIDGTEREKSNTRVLFELLSENEKQLKYYHGVLSSPNGPFGLSWTQAMQRNIDVAFAWRWKITVVKIYSWLSENYKEGDLIFLIGFSRGALQARVLSAMIDKVGLLKDGEKSRMNNAYDLYEECAISNSRQAPMPLKQNDTLDSNLRAAEFKQSYSRDVRVHFVGAWDTVASAGFFKNKRLLGIADGMEHVCNFRHALALDERRARFAPLYAQVVPQGRRGATEVVHPQYIRDRKSPEASAADTREVWFVGTHEDIGGANIDTNKKDRSGPPLSWMLSEALECGALIREDEENISWSWRNTDTVHRSLKSIWTILELLPLKGSHNTGYRPHLGRKRIVQGSQLIHQSVLVDHAHNRQYKPKAYLLDRETNNTISWLRFFRHDPRDRLERDLFDDVQTLVKAFQSFKEDYPTTHGTQKALRVYKLAEQLQQTVKLSPAGQWTVRVMPGAFDSIAAILALIRGEPECEEPCKQLWEAVIQLFGSLDLFNKNNRNVLESFVPALSHVLQDSSPRAEEAKKILQKFFHDHTKPFSMGNLTGNGLGPAEIKNLCDKGVFALVYTADDLHSITISPDGRHIVTGSNNNTIQVWDALTGTSVTQPLKGHKDFLQSVFNADSSDQSSALNRFSRVPATPLPDVSLIRKGSRRVAAGSSAEPKRHADSQTKELMLPISYTADGRYIVTGSEDNTLRVFDASSRNSVSPPLTGHTDAIRSIAVSPNARYIASGSDDRTVRIWETASGQSLGVLQGHEDAVNGVSFTHDSEYVFSCSNDRTIRRWSLAANNIR